MQMILRHFSDFSQLVHTVSSVSQTFISEGKTKTDRTDKQQEPKGIKSGSCKVFKRGVMRTTQHTTSANKQGIKFDFYEGKSQW